MLNYWLGKLKIFNIYCRLVKKLEDLDDEEIISELDFEELYEAIGNVKEIRIVVKRKFIIEEILEFLVKRYKDFYSYRLGYCLIF